MKERAIWYYCHGASCAKAILLAVRDCYGRVTCEVLQSASGLCGGFVVGGFCGAVAAAVLALGLFYDEAAAQRERMILLSQIQSRFGSLQCCRLRPCGASCQEVVGFVAQVLEDCLRRCCPSCQPGAGLPPGASPYR